MRMRTLLLMPCLLPLLSAPAWAGPAIRVVSVLGGASAEGQPLAAGQSLTAGTEVDVAAGGVLQLLLDRTRLAASICGKGQVRLAAGSADVEVRGEPVVRLAGEGTLATDALRVEVRGTVVLERGSLYVLAGHATASAPSARLVPVQAGNTARVSSDGSLRVTPGAPQEAAVRGTVRYASPEPWDPEVAVDLSVVRRARQEVQQQQQRDRELASCGCTESSGPGAATVQSSTVEHRPEGRQATVRVRVLGVPKRIP
jgi:hypothetical protein